MENGKGKLFELRLNEIYDGEFINSLKSGFGKEYDFKRRSFFEGYFLEDQKNGEGQYIEVEENIKGLQKFIGNFEKNQKSGYGKLYDGQKLLYEGEFANNFPNGKGKLYTSSGIYEGEISNSKMHGKGKFFYTIGARKDLIYEGTWNNGLNYGEYIVFNKELKILKKGIVEEKK